jgi:hypothetical protein
MSFFENKELLLAIFGQKKKSSFGHNEGSIKNTQVQAPGGWDGAHSQ